jgi:hypothetical protein
MPFRSFEFRTARLRQTRLSTVEAGQRFWPSSSHRLRRDLRAAPPPMPVQMLGSHDLEPPGPRPGWPPVDVRRRARRDPSHATTAQPGSRDAVWLPEPYTDTPIPGSRAAGQHLPILGGLDAGAGHGSRTQEMEALRLASRMPSHQPSRRRLRWSRVRVASVLEQHKQGSTRTSWCRARWRPRRSVRFRSQRGTTVRSRRGHCQASGRGEPLCRLDPRGPRRHRSRSRLSRRAKAALCWPSDLSVSARHEASRSPSGRSTHRDR